MDSTKEKDEIAKYTGYGDDFLKSLNQLRGDDSHTDHVTIIIGGRRIHAHKLVLSAASLYFRTMFTSGFQESNQSEITVEGDGDLFERLLDFTYTGKICLTDARLPTLIRTALYFQFDKALSVCEQYLQKRFKSETISYDFILEVADAFGPLRNIAEDHLTTNFIQFSASASFNNISVPVLESFLDRNDLTALSKLMTEDNVRDAVTKWLLFSWEDREVYAEQLLKKVRLGCCDDQSVDKEIMSIPACRQMHALAAIQSVLQLQPPRSIFLLLRVVVTPISGKLLTKYYQTTSFTWAEVEAINSLPAVTTSSRYQNDEAYSHRDVETRHINAIISAGGELYMHIDQTTWKFNNFYWFNAYTNNWNIRQSIHRFGDVTPVFVPFKKFIYAVGGIKSDATDYTTTVRRFETDRQGWRSLPPIPIPADSVECSHKPVAVDLGAKLLVYVVLRKKNEEEGILTIVIFVCCLSDDLQDCRWYRSPLCRTRNNSCPVRLVTDKNKCYLVKYKTGETRVTELVFDFEKLPSIIKIREGKAYNQSQVPQNRIGGFCIEGDMYANLNGHITPLGITVKESDKLRKEMESFEEAVRPVDGHRPVFVQNRFEKFGAKLGLPKIQTANYMY